jgi:hypothetical protein
MAGIVTPRRPPAAGRTRERFAALMAVILTGRLEASTPDRTRLNFARGAADHSA